MHEFKVGDRVKCLIDNLGADEYKAGDILVVTEVDKAGDPCFGENDWWFASTVLASTDAFEIIPA